MAYKLLYDPNPLDVLPHGVSYFAIHHDHDALFLAYSSFNCLRVFLLMRSTVAAFILKNIIGFSI